MYGKEMHRNGDRLPTQAIRYPSTLDSVHGAFTIQGLPIPNLSLLGVADTGDVSQRHRGCSGRDARAVRHGCTWEHTELRSWSDDTTWAWSTRTTKDYIKVGPYTPISFASTSFMKNRFCSFVSVALSYYGPLLQVNPDCGFAVSTLRLTSLHLHHVGIDLFQLVSGCCTVQCCKACSQNCCAGSGPTTLPRPITYVATTPSWWHGQSFSAGRYTLVCAPAEQSRAQATLEPSSC